MNIELLRESIENGELETFKNVYPLHSREIQQRELRTICAYGQLEMLKFALHYVEFEDSNKYYDIAVRSGNILLVEEMELYGFKKTSDTINAAIDSGSIEMVNYIYSPGDTICPEPASVTTLDILKFVIDNGGALDVKKVLEYTCNEGRVDILDFIIKKLGPISPNMSYFSFECSYYGQGLETLKYLVEAGLMEKDEEFIEGFTWAYEHNYVEMAEYFILHHDLAPEGDDRLYRTIMERETARKEKLMLANLREVGPAKTKKI